MSSNKRRDAHVRDLELSEAGEERRWTGSEWWVGVSLVRGVSVPWLDPHSSTTPPHCFCWRHPQQWTSSTTNQLVTSTTTADSGVQQPHHIEHLFVFLCIISTLCFCVYLIIHCLRWSIDHKVNTTSRLYKVRTFRVRRYTINILMRWMSWFFVSLCSLSYVKKSWTLNSASTAKNIRVELKL